MGRYTRFLAILALGSGISIGLEAAAETRLTASIAYQNKDYENAMAIWRSLAQRGDSEVNICIGLMHLRGHGTPRNSTKAAKWFKEAAISGIAEAQFLLGRELMDGTPADYDTEPLDMDQDEGLRWYKVAVSQGHSEAAIYVGHAYSYAQGVDQNYEEAFRWYKRAAHLGNGQGAWTLGFMYWHGQGIQADAIKSLTWFKISEALRVFYGVYTTKVIEDLFEAHQISEAELMAERWIAKHKGSFAPKYQRPCRPTK